MVSVSDSQSGGPGLESRFSHFPGFVLGRPELKSATLVNSQLIASYQLGFLILLCALSTIIFSLFFRSSSDFVLGIHSCNQKESLKILS